MLESPNSGMQRKKEHSALQILEAANLFMQVCGICWHGTGAGIGLLDSKGFFPGVVFILLKEDRATKHLFFFPEEH